MFLIFFENCQTFEISLKLYNRKLLDKSVEDLGNLIGSGFYADFPTLEFDLKRPTNNHDRQGIVSFFFRNY